MDIMLYITAGFCVGLAIGMTGIGGGSLMTPLLLLFGFPAHVAIGTDLVYAALTKCSGAYIYHRQGSVNWGIIKALCIGSIPSTIVTVYLLKFVFSGSDHYSSILTTCLGFMLSLTAISILLRDKLSCVQNKISMLSSRQLYGLTIVIGFFLGALVTLSSVGAGAIGTAVLIILYPALRPASVISTEVVHAVPLAFIAGMGHIWLGNVDFFLLLSLLVGSVPAIYLGAKLNHRVPDTLLQKLLGFVLLFIGIRYMF